MINDGSTDGSGFAAEEQKKVLGQYGIAAKVMHQNNLGAAVARNNGFKNATGEYVIFWDADTVGKPEMLKRMANELLTHPLVSYVYCKFKYGWKTMKGRNYDADALRKMSYIDTTSLVRRADFPGWDESLKRFQDWDVWLTMLEQGKEGEFIPEVLYTKIVQGRKGGMSNWLPNFMHRLPWKIKKIRAYEEAMDIVKKKHNLK